MIANFYSSVLRVTLFWYVLGVLVLFFGLPEWAESRYVGLSMLPWVPILELDGISTAASVQWTLVIFWTVPVVIAWAVCILLGLGIVELRYRFAVKERALRLAPRGEFWGVHIPKYSLGSLPTATTPGLSGRPVHFDTPGVATPKLARRVAVDGPMKEALKMVSPAERKLCEELLQVLMSDPEHFAGLGHGVGLLEHTLNVVVEAAGKCTPEFRLPLVAALAHDIGKLITFQPDGAGGWVRKGLHSRESARILATLPSFQELPEAHQRGLILAVKYDHAPSKMPELRGDREASMLGMRIISALSSADKTATAAEKERNLEKLQPEDLLWKDFVDFLRDAPVVQRGKKGAANQINNPPDNPFLFVYEAQWRDEAILRMPAEIAAALDLTRRDAGKLAKYTRILAERLRKEGLLVEEHEVTKDGATELLKTSDGNPLWDIQSGTGEKAVVMRGILVLRADELWKKVNFRLSVKSPFPVTILAPNANVDGRVNQAPQANREVPGTPDVSDGLKLTDVQSAESMASLGLDSPADGAQGTGGTGKPRARSRGAFRAPVPDGKQDAELGLGPTSAGGTKPPAKIEPTLAATAKAPPAEEPPAAEPPAQDPAADAPQEMEWDDPTIEEMEAAAYPEPDTEPAPAADSTASALAFFKTSAPVAEAPAEPAPAPKPAAAAAPVSPPAERAPKPKPSPAQAQPAEVKQQTKQKPQAPAAPLKEPAVSATPPIPAAPASAELSRAEKREGLSVADEAAVAKYPGLALGDKFYTEESSAVQAGLRKPGSRYKGDTRERKLELSETGPRRRVRRVT